MKNPTPASTYDLIPYPMISFVEAHPDRMAAIARLSGLNPPSVENCRVLEFGCAGGGNLIPMAYALPGSQFLGIDMSQEQVGQGQNIITQIGLNNIEIRCQNIMDFCPDGRPFDYIIAHGVYSWVPVAVQQKMLSICREHLADNGIAYFSYNVLPGWSLRIAAREMLYYLTRDIQDPVERYIKSMEMLDLLVQNESTNASKYYREYMAKIATTIQEDADHGNNFNYWIHEYLEDNNRPMYFHEFIEQLEKSELSYLGDAEFFRMFSNDIPDQQKSRLQNQNFSLTDFEQCLDFLRNRPFRRSLVCRHRPTDRLEPVPSRMAGLRISSAFRPTIKEYSLNNSDEISFVAPDEITITEKEPVVKAAFTLLYQAHPHSIRFEDLVKQSRSACCLPMPPNWSENDDARLICSSIFEAYSYTPYLEITTRLPAYARTPGDNPVASPIIRIQARTTGLATNLKHNRIQLEEFDRWLLLQMDGGPSRHDLVRQMLTAYDQNALPLEVGEHAAADRPDIFEKLLEGKLNRYAANAILV